MASVAAIGTGNDPRSNDDALRAHLDRYEQSIDLSQDARRKSLKSVQYYENVQWTDAEIKELRSRKQPVVVENHIQPKIDFLVGLEITTRTDPKAFPRTEEDAESADVATDSVRYVLDANEFPALASDCWGDMLKPGYTAVELGVQQGPEGAEIKIQGWKWDRLFADPFSRKLDYSDANFLGGVKWMDFNQARLEFPGEENEAKLRMALAYGDLSDTHDDRPRFAVTYSDRQRERVMIIYMWHRLGDQWAWAKFTRGGVLQSAPCPYINDKGKHWCPLIMQAAYKDIENNAYGLVEYMKSTQDEINHRRSRAMFNLSRRGVIKSVDAVTMDDATLRREVARPDYVITKGSKDAYLEIDTGQDLSQGQMALLAESQTHMDRLGPNASMAGKDQREQSGRALLAQSQSGFVELQPLLDRHRHFKRRVHIGVWWMIRQYWTEQKAIRITDNENAPKFIGLNEEMTRLEYDVARMQEQGRSEQEIQQHVIMLFQSQRAYERVVKNQVARMQMDFVIEEVQDHATVQTEAYQQLLEFMPNFVQLLQISPRIAKAVLEASPLRNKKALVEAIDGPTEDPQAQQQQAIQQQLQMRGAMADIAGREGDAVLKQAQAQKAQLEAQKTQVEAQLAPVAAEADVLKGRAAYIQAVRPPF